MIRYCYKSFLLLLIVRNLVISSHNNDYDTLFIQDYCGDPLNQTHEVGASHLYGFILASNQTYYQENKTCQIELRVRKDFRLTVRFVYIDIYTAKSNSGCKEDSLTITGETNSKTYCGTHVSSNSLYSTANYLKFTFSTQGTPPGIWKGFKLHYTAYHTDHCGDNEYTCRYQRRCIPKELACDRYDNCGDWSDEKYCSGMSTGVVIALATCITITCLCLIFMIIIIVYKKISARKLAKRNRRRSTCVTHARVARVADSVYSTPDPVDSVYEAPPSYYAVFYNESSAFPDTNDVYARIDRCAPN